VVYGADWLTADSIALGPPPPAASAVLAALGDDWLTWLARAATQDDILLYIVYCAGTPVGLIFVHDLLGVEALVGYALLAEYRGRGIGTLALRLVQNAATARGLALLTIITGVDNAASRRLAARCGFGYIGPAREAPEELVVYQWHAPAKMGA
jgi:RimJ/RimL family protein N-acetyltransferase